MKNQVRGLALILFCALALSACVSRGVEKYANIQEAVAAPVGSDYFIMHYHGNLPGVANSPPATWTLVQYRQLQKLQGDCYEDLGPQLKGTGTRSAVKETTLMTLGDGIGLGLGSLGIPYLKPLQSAIYGAGAGGGTGLADNDMRHGTAVSYATGYCMALNVYMAQIRDHALNGVGIIPNVDIVDPNEKGVPIPAGREPVSNGPVQTENGPLPPPPR